jgi:hypothetical protein
MDENRVKAVLQGPPQYADRFENQISISQDTAAEFS